MSARDDWESEAGPATQASRQAQVPAHLEFVEAEDDEEVLEVEPEPAEEELAQHRPAGIARRGSLHSLIQIESLSRTTGVLLVLSGDDSGYLHLIDGELVHAETGRLSGESAALEILSWSDATLEPSLRTLAPLRTVHSSLQSLLAQLGVDLGGLAQPPLVSSLEVRSPGQRVLDQDAPTETYLPPVTAPTAPAVEGAPAPETAAAAASPPEASSEPASPPRSVVPPPLPRPERDAPSAVTDVVLSAAGEMIQGRGAATEELAARVAYAARLAELIGRAIRSGTPRAVELRGKSTQTLVRWQGDGNLSASLDLPQPSRR